MADDLTHSSSGTPPAPGAEIVAPLSTRTLFWRARFLRESPFLIHIPFLFWLIETARPGCLVKLGLGDGVGYFAACQALDRVETETECVAIEPSGRATGEGWDELRRYNEENYADFSTLLSCDIRSAANRFPDGSVDLLIVDTDVDEALIDCLSHDWPRKLSDRAVVVFHGSATRFSEGRAAGFMSRIMVTYPTASFEAGSGLMMVLFGQTRQDRLLRLAELRPGVRGYSEIHHVFRRLGATHEFEWADRENTAREAALKERLRQGETGQARLHQEKAALERELAEAKAAPSAEEAKAAEDLRRQLEQVREESERVQDGLRAEIRDLTEQLDTARNEAAAAETAREESERVQDGLRTEIRELTEQLDTARAEAAAAETAREESERAQDGLRAEIRELMEQLETARGEAATERERYSAEMQALETAQAGVVRLTEALERRETELETLRAHTAGHAKELAKLTEALERAENERLTDTERLKAELAEMRAHRDSLRAHTAGHAKELAKLTEALERAENERLTDTERLKTELAEMRAHRDALLASTSWKMTAPIRRIVVAARGH